VSADEIDQQFPYIQIHRSVAAKAAMLAARTGVEYFKLRGVLDCWWESMADRRILAKAIETDGVLVSSEQVEQAITRPCDGKVTPADMVAAGFLEPRETMFRARGMSRYIDAEHTRLTKKAHRNNPTRTPVAPRSDPGGTPVTPRSHPGRTPVTPDIVETKDERGETKDERRKTVDERPPSPSKADTMVDRFWQHAQRERVEIFGRVQERPPQPRQLSKWFNEATLELRGDTRRLQAAWSMYCHDPYWLDRGVPWAGFMAQWQKFVPPAQPVDPNDPTAWPLTEVAS